jgi:pimeloyl-ACP methyl ester carboxylesterase
VVGDGYAVITVDRLGYGDSPYPVPGGGFALNFNGYVEMTHEIVTQIKNGTYGVARNNSCSSTRQASVASRSVSLLGHSIGGGTGMAYAMRYHDIDALISIAWTNQGLPSTVLNFFGMTVIPTCTSGSDYTLFFQPGPGSRSADCMLGTVYAPGMSNFMEDLWCGNTRINEELSPCGELLGAMDLIAYNVTNVGNVGSTPVLLVWGEFDNFVTHAGYAGPMGIDPDLVTPEVNMWQTRCNCDVTSIFQQDTGHVEPLHNSVDDISDSITDWLESRGID